MRLLNFGVKGKCTEKNHAFQILQDRTPDLTRITRREGGSWASCHLPSSVAALMLLVFESSESHSVVSESLRPHGLYIVHGILLARILEWVAVLFFRASSQPRD